MDYLKHRCLAQGKKPAEGSISSFHQTFLSNIKRFGRANETILMIAYHLKTARTEKRVHFKAIFKAFRLGIRLIKKGRLNLFPFNYNWNKRPAIKKPFGS
jgi:hypothetical protein